VSDNIFADLESYSHFPLIKPKRGMMRGKKSLEEQEAAMPPMVPMEGFTFGCDPEGFIRYKDKFVPADGLIPGTKAKPEDVGDGVFLQVDGMAAEYNILPCKTFEEFDSRNEMAIKKINDLLPKGHEFVAIPAVRFDPEVFDSATDQSKELGCTPDHNAWTGEINPPPADPDDPYLRTASGHLHIGWGDNLSLADPQHILNCRDLVKQLDWFLGGWSIKTDPDPTRRKLYGKAGACRFKDYGVEYRVLSNFWITERSLRLAVWNRMQSAIQMMASIYMPDRAPKSYNDFLVAGINDGTLADDSAMLSNFQYPLLTTNNGYNRW
jgi:hypothetical protein